MTAQLIKLPQGRTRVEPDPDLAELAAKGDRAAFSELVRRHQGLVRGMMRRLTGGHQADADDLGQAAFMKAWTQIGSYSGGTFKSWLCAIAFREFLQATRKTKARARIADAVQTITAGQVEAANSGLKRDMDEALTRLPEHQRIAVVLCISAGLSHGEVARITGWPLGTVKSHVTRGRVALQASLIDYGAA